MTDLDFTISFDGLPRISTRHAEFCEILITVEDIRGTGLQVSLACCSRFILLFQSCSVNFGVISPTTACIMGKFLVQRVGAW